ncbi:hypothetical protein Tco_1023981 [Tanacetum coccineum]
MNVDDSFLMQFIMNSLTLEYGSFYINYNTLQDKWNIDELSSKLNQEARLKKQIVHFVNLVNQGVDKSSNLKPRTLRRNNTVQPQRLLMVKRRNTWTTNANFAGKIDISKRIVLSVSSRIVETGNAKFMENGEVSGSVKNQVVDINEIRDDHPPPMDVHKSTTIPDVVPVFQNQEQF